MRSEWVARSIVQLLAKFENKFYGLLASFCLILIVYLLWHKKKKLKSIIRVYFLRRKRVDKCDYIFRWVIIILIIPNMAFN